MARVVVTGGAGFIGSHLCERLIERGDAVICVDNLITGRRANLLDLLTSPRFTLLEQDIVDGVSVEGRVDAVVHLASPASPIDYQRLPMETLLAGILGTRCVLELARRHRARFLLASTSEVYGDPLEHPQRESYLGNVNPIGPRAVYDEGKRVGETFTVTYRRVHGLETRIARIFNTYGPRMREDDGRVVPTFIGQALSNRPLTVFGDGAQTRSLCYIDDLVEGLLRLLDSDIDAPVNLGNPCETTVLQLARTVIEVTGSSSSIERRALPVDDPARRRPDITRARAGLGWRPRIGLGEGLARTLSPGPATAAAFAGDCRG